jgi:uncharacterized protein (TIGR02284 family)
MTNEQLASTLNHLIETCRDGQNGFETAASAVKDQEVRRLFEEFSRQRAQYVSELQTEVQRLGAMPETSGSVAAAVHRGWMNIKSAVTGGDDVAILDEAERGEDTAVEAYRQTLADTPGSRSDLTSSNFKELIARQLRGIQDAHDRVRELRDRRRVTHATAPR